MTADGRGRRSVAVIALALTLGACGSSDGGEAIPDETTAAKPAEATPTTTAADGEVIDTEELTASAPDVEESWVEIFPEIALTATEPGPRPLLSWSGVDDAALYQLTVLDADGVPYWAWSGTETSVHLGGMENPDAIGAWVFEPLSWMVVARDASGAPVGMSMRGQLLP